MFVIKSISLMHIMKYNNSQNIYIYVYFREVPGKASGGPRGLSGVLNENM